MVLKQKKYSVPSGTTFRTGSRAYRSKYLKQATLVKTLRNADADDLAADDHIHPGVEYSLNKKGRWNLPKQIREQFEDSDEKVSLQQFHKIKKKAKCISYETNKGPFTKVVPKKYYFDVGSVEPKKVVNPPVEVVYSIYLPAGAKSAITYNPKYIDVPVNTIAEDGQTTTAVSKKGRTTKRRTLRLNVDASYDDVDWTADDHSYDSPDTNNLSDESDCGVAGRLSEWNLSDDFDGYVELALQKKELERYERLEMAKKQASSSKPDVISYKDRKVYVDAQPPPYTCSKKGKKASVIESPVSLKSFEISLPNRETGESYLLEKFAVSFQEAATCPRRFVIDFSDKLSEAVNDNITAYLCVEEMETLVSEKLHRVWTQSTRPLGCRVPRTQQQMTCIDDVIAFIIDSCIESKMAGTKKLRKRSRRTPASETDKNRTQYAQAATSQLISHPITFSNLKQACGWNVVSDLPHRLATSNDATETEVLNRYLCTDADLGPDADLCSICLMEANSSENFRLTGMTSCGHAYCQQCWVGHVTSVLTSGGAKVTCPNYGCDTELSDGFVQSLVEPDFYQAYVTVRMENYLAANKWSWCPNSQCGRVVKTEANGTSGRYMNVECECRLNMCSDCKEQSHWPASCRQANAYRQMLKNRGDDVEQKIIPSVFVRYVPCPHCGRAVEKVVGCNFVWCLCEQAFCWACGGRWNDETTHGSCLQAPLKKAELEHIPTPQSMADVPSGYARAVVHHRELYRTSRIRTAAEFSRITKRAMNVVRKAAPSELGHSAQIIHESRTDFTELETTALEVLNELHHCAEYTNVCLLYRKPRSLPCPQTIEQCVDKIHFVTLRFHQLLASDERPASEIIAHLRNYSSIGRKCIFRLVHALRVNGLT